MTVAYYNEIDPYAAEWLRNLIAAGHIAYGVVDEHSIVDVDPEYLARFTQCHCIDGKSRPVEPGTFPLAHGVPGRVGLLRGYGNAIVPQVAAAFIEASIM